MSVIDAFDIATILCTYYLFC